LLGRCQEALPDRKQLEADISKVDVWTKETASVCQSPLNLDCPLDLLDDQLRRHQVNKNRFMSGILNFMDYCSVLLMNIYTSFSLPATKTKLTDLFQGLHNAATSLSTLLQEISHKTDSMKPELNSEDLSTLEAQRKELQEDFERFLKHLLCIYTYYTSVSIKLLVMVFFNL